MEIHTNAKMDEILLNNRWNFISENIELPEALQIIIAEGFKIENDCVLFKEFVYFGAEQITSDYDKTSFEDFINHIHTESYLEDNRIELDYLKTGLQFAKDLYNKLQALPGKFRIMVSFYETTYDNGSIDSYGSCTVRFYTIRESCDDKFKIDNLEDFKTDAVLTVE